MRQCRPFIDAHVHGFLRPSDRIRFQETVTALTGCGLERIVITALPRHDLSYECKISLAPPHIRPVISRDPIDETALLHAWTREFGLEEIIVPFVDLRFVHENLRLVAEASRASTWGGIKGAYLPRADRILDIQGIPQALGISPERYLSVQEDLFRYAQDHRLPLLYHVNLAEHFDWVCEVLVSFPRLRICIPHLGYSLRRITQLLDRFPNVYTDPSYLIAVLQKNNPRYCSFLRNYHTRILLGSDAIIVASTVEEILSYARYFNDCAMAEEVKRRILRDNACSFLSITG